MSATNAAAIERANLLSRQLQVALGLIDPRNDPLRAYTLSGAADWSMRGCPNAGGGIYADTNAMYLDAGHKRHFNNSVLIPARAFLRALVSRGLRARSQNYQTTVTGSGAELVESTLRSDLFINALRPRSVVLSLGAQAAGGLKGDIQIPRQVTTSSGYWVTTSGTSPVVSGAITESEATFDSTPLIVAPAQIGCMGKISRVMLLQAAELSDYFIATDVTRTLGSGIDTTALSGTGTGAQPAGITNTSGVNAVSGTTFANSTAITTVQDVAAANGIVDRGSLGWVATPAVAGTLAGRNKVAANSYSPIWEGSVDTGVINGHPALSTTNAPAGTAIFGDWSQILLLSWGDVDAPIELEFNPFTGNFAGGDVAYRALLSANLVVRHPPSFTVVSSIS